MLPLQLIYADFQRLPRLPLILRASAMPLLPMPRFRCHAAMLEAISAAYADACCRHTMLRFICCSIVLIRVIH